MTTTDSWTKSTCGVGTTCPLGQLTFLPSWYPTCAQLGKALIPMGLVEPRKMAECLQSRCFSAPSLTHLTFLGHPAPGIQSGFCHPQTFLGALPPPRTPCTSCFLGPHWVVGSSSGMILLRASPQGAPPQAVNSFQVASLCSLACCRAFPHAISQHLLLTQGI